MRHKTDLMPKARIARLRVRRAGSNVWEDHSELIGGDMRVKCVTCGEVNAISAHQDYEGQVGWGCGACGEYQTLVPATLEQWAWETTKKGKK